MQMLQFSVEFKGQGVLVRKEGSDQLTDATDLTLEYTKGTQVYFRTRSQIYCLLCLLTLELKC